MTYSRFLECSQTTNPCLLYLKEKHFGDRTECPKCGKASKFHWIRGRWRTRAGTAGITSPTARAIFHKSTVSLQLWFLRHLSDVVDAVRHLGAAAWARIRRDAQTAHPMFKRISPTIVAMVEGRGRVRPRVVCDRAAPARCGRDQNARAAEIGAVHRRAGRLRERSRRARPDTTASGVRTESCCIRGEAPGVSALPGPPIRRAGREIRARSGPRR